MKIVFAKYDIDTGYVYGQFEHGDIVLIDCTAYKRAYAEDMYERSELDYLIFNDPAGYVELAMEKHPREYLKSVSRVSEIRFSYQQLSDLR